MNDALLQALLRLLPSLIVVALGFVAASDTKTRERWTDLLYQAGSLRPDQKADPAKQRSVRLPFFAVAFCLVYWPITYYLHATRTVDVISNPYGNVTPKKAAPTAAPAGTPGAPAGTPEASPSPAAPTPTAGFSPYGAKPANP